MNASQTLTPPSAGDLPAGPMATEEKPRRKRRLIVLFFLLGLLALLLGLATWYLLFRQPIVPTIPGIPDTQLPAFSTSVFGPSRPTGVTVTADGERILMTDTAGDRLVHVYDKGGTEISTLQLPVSKGTDHVPVYLAIQPATGEIFVSDRLQGTIYVFNADGTYAREITPPDGSKAWQPLGMTFDKAGNMYVTDVSTDPQVVLKIAPDGKLQQRIGADQGLSFPNGVAVDDAGVLYVTDSNNGRLLAFAEDGQVVAQVGRGGNAGNLGLPRGVVVVNGLVYVVDASAQAVQVYRTAQPDSRRLEFVGKFGDAGAEDGAFNYPNQIAADGRGRVYIADTGNDRTQVWSR